MNEVYYRGRLRPARKVFLSPLNSGILFGESLFETFPVYGGKPLFFQDHIERFKKGCRLLRWGFPAQMEFKKAIDLFARKYPGMPDLMVRFNLSQELEPPAGPRSFDFRRPVLFATARPLRHDIQSSLPPVGRIGLSPWMAQHAGMFPTGFKTASYLTTRLTFRAHPEWDEILRSNDRGEVVDGGGATPFWYDGQVLWTSPLELGGLASVTRKKVLGLCRRLGLRVAERPWKASRISKKGELFFAGSGVAILSISHYQGRPLRAYGPLTLRLWQHYRSWASRL